MFALVLNRASVQPLSKMVDHFALKTNNAAANVAQTRRETHEGFSLRCIMYHRRASWDNRQCGLFHHLRYCCRGLNDHPQTGGYPTNRLTMDSIPSPFLSSRVFMNQARCCVITIRNLRFIFALSILGFFLSFPSLSRFASTEREGIRRSIEAIVCFPGRSRHSWLPEQALQTVIIIMLINMNRGVMQATALIFLQSSACPCGRNQGNPRRKVTNVSV